MRTLRFGPADLLRDIRSRFGRQAPRAAGTAPDLMPPRRLVFVGGKEFRAVGEALKNQLIAWAGLEPHHRVLDIGCGIGRVAIPLTRYMEADGSYEGFDIVPEGVRWCQEHISKRHPNFRFQLADIQNQVYNPLGRYQADEYVFPFADQSFDRVFATSVFTHMRDTEVERYLSEIARVLVPGTGKAFLTFFLLNSDSTAAIEAGRSSLDMRFRLGRSRATSAIEPEKAIAHPEDWLRERAQAAGLKFETPIHYGNWCGRSVDETYQDIVIMQRAEADHPSTATVN